MTTDNKENCLGCQNIEESNFPFISRNMIDQEHCGINGAEYLFINFCPVCGKELE